MIKPTSFYHNTTRAAVFSLALLAVSCSADQTNENNDKQFRLSEVQNQPDPAPMPTKGTRIPISEMKIMEREEQVLFAREDLAQRLGLALDKVSLSGATPVIWRSGALGCPKPGMEYTQALVKGLLLMLRVGNTAYRYHGIPGGEPFYCPDSQAEPPYTNSGDA